MRVDGIVESLVDNANSAERGPHDFEKEGLLYCGECHEPKQAWIEFGGEKRLCAVMCRCQREKYEADKAETARLKREMLIANMRGRYGIQPRGIEKLTFDKDEEPTSKLSLTCRKYVEKWDEMSKDNIGILFYGSKGAGKTFYASCISNELAKREKLTAVTTTAMLVNLLQGEWDKTEVLEHLNRYELLVLDDLGAERSTTYGSELMYTVIDGRYKAGRPTIVTTNFDLADMQEETDIWRGRLYDRVIEMCPITLKVNGVSKRSALAEERRQKARYMMR